MPNYLKKINVFKIVSLLTSALYFYLFIVLLLFPETLCEDIGITGNESLYYLAKRASMLMLGFSVLLFLFRNLPPSKARQAVSFTVSINMAGFSLTGVFGLIHGIVNNSIFESISIELLVTLLFLHFLVSDNKYLKKSN